jgi:hypothetical protein
MTCQTCRFFRAHPTAAVAADGECTWPRVNPPFWLAGVLPPGPAWIDLGDGEGCAAYQPPATARVSRAKTYTRTSEEAERDE